MTKSMFKISHYAARIEPVLVDHTTDKFVVFPQKHRLTGRNLKEMKNGRYFDTFEEARDNLVSNLESELKNCEDAAAECRERLEKAKRLKP